MPTLTEQRDAARKAALDIAEAAEGRDYTDEEVETINTKTAEFEDLERRIEQNQRAKDGLSRIGSHKPKDADEKLQAKSLGDFFVGHVKDRITQVKGTRGWSLACPEFIPKKAATDPHTVSGAALGDYLTQFDTSIVQDYRRTSVASLLGSGSISGTAITYIVEGLKEGDFTTVAEGAAKPQLHFNYSTVTDALSKIAGFIKVSDEMLEDLAFLVSEINGRLLYELSLAEENQLLNGDGTGTNVLGLLNRDGIQSEASAGAADNLDAIFRARTKVQTATGLSADGLVVNPLDYQAFRLSKDANGQYFGGGPFSGAYGNGGLTLDPPVWGLNTAVSAAIPQGTALVGAFKQASTVYRKGGVRVESTNSHADDFTNNMNTIRAEERVALAVRRPAAMVQVTLSGATPPA